MKLSTDLRVSILLGIVVFLISWTVGSTIVADYTPEQSFVHYRLAYNLQAGHGLVYNAGDTTLVTLSPLFPLILAPAARYDLHLSWLLSGLMMTISGIITYYILRRLQLSRAESFLAVILWSVAYPVSAAFRSEEMFIFFGVLLSWLLLEKDRPRLAGLIVGVAVLFQLQRVAAVVLLGLYSFGRRNGWRYWQTAWIPIAGWGIIAVILYQDVAIPFSTAQARPIDTLWIVLFFATVIVLRRIIKQSSLWMIIVWAATDLCTAFLIYKNFPRISSLALALSVSVGVSLSGRLFPQNGVIPYRVMATVLFLVLFIGAPPVPIRSDLEDRALAQALNIPPDSSLVHDLSTAFAYDYDGIVHHLNGQLSGNEGIQRDDVQSRVVMLAPEYLLIHEQTLDLSNPNLAALNYTQIDQHDDLQLWQRQSEVGNFHEVKSLDIQVRDDMHITGFASDRTRVNRGEVIRIRIDWRLDYPPEDRIGLNLSMRDMAGQSIDQIMVSYPAEIWSALSTSTFHAFFVPQDTETSVFRINVIVEYLAGTVGQQVVGEFVVPPPNRSVDRHNLKGTLGDIVLYASSFALTEEQLYIDLVWGTQHPVEKNYTVFVHLVSLDDPAPLVQADGPPLDGRFPTSYWQTEDIIAETRALDLSGLPSGNYQINAGFYDDQNSRLTGESGESLIIGYVTIDQENEITIQSES